MCNVYNSIKLAKQYYPRLWPLERLDKLLELGRITQAEYTELTGMLEAGDGGANPQSAFG